MLASNPIGGVGLGGFDPALRELQARPGHAGISAEKLPRLKTAHSTYFHALAVTGLAGLGLLLAVLWRGMRDAKAFALRSAGGDWAGTYAAGPCVALVGLALCGLFETIQLNTPLACVASVLLALSPSAMPRTELRCHPYRPGTLSARP
jgi:O-antigen ligase